MRATADVVVVGGGVIGCATAAELAQAGADVMLLERAEIASGASGRNHGLIFYPQNETVGPLYRASHSMYRELSDTCALDLSLDQDPQGFLIVVNEEDEWIAAESEAKASSAGGIRTERLDARALREAEPGIGGRYLGGYRIEDGYRVDPSALTLALAFQARGAGAEVVTHTDVKQILVRRGRVTGVATDDGIVQAPIVVDAAGPWSSRLARTAGGDLPVAGARGWILLARPAGPVVRHLVESSGWHLLAGDLGPPEVTVGGYASGELPVPADVGVIIQPSRSGHVLIGGSRLAALHEQPEGVEEPREIARRAVAMVPALADAPLVSAWSGIRPMSPDGYPLIGWLPGFEGFFVATAHGGQGVMLGGGTGRLARQMILESEPLADPSPFAPDRF